MIELKKLHDSFLMHQAFVAVAAAAAAQFNSINSPSSTIGNIQNTTAASAQDDILLQINSLNNSTPALSDYSPNPSISSSQSRHSFFNHIQSTILKTNEDSELNEDLDRKLNNTETNSDSESETELKGETEDDCIEKKASIITSLKRKFEEETDIEVCVEKYVQVKQNQRKPSSFLISDILGLDSTSDIHQNLLKQNLNQYSLEFQRSIPFLSQLTAYDLYRSFNNCENLNQLNYSKEFSLLNNGITSPLESITSFATTSNNRDNDAKVNKNASNSILSSLEQLTKSEFSSDSKISYLKAKSIDTKNSNNSKQKRPILDMSKETENTIDSSTELFTKTKKSTESNSNSNNQSNSASKANNPTLWPAWVYCTRYSDRPSAGPRHRKKTKNNNKCNSKCSSSNKNQISNDSKKKDQSYSSSSSSNSSFSLSSPSQSILNVFNTISKKSNSGFDQPNENDYKSDNEEMAQEEFDDIDDNDSDASNSKRPRTAFTSSQLNRLKHEFEKCKYLTGEKRQYLANELNLNESQIKIWFQNKRAKIKKTSGVKNSLAMQLMAQGLYNHSKSSKSDQNDN